ncbi:MAG: cytochrome b N-terminal domain-containing protein [Nitrososphaerales archaeon]
MGDISKESKEEEKAKNPIVKLYDYVVDRLERTLFFGLRFTFPSKFVSPFGFLGVLTFVTFIVLGVTGAILMYYYVPTLDRAYDTVKEINDVIPFGFAIRNIHYHASNAMVFLAVLHLYYQYFSGRFKIRNEILWSTGVILGLLTVLEAFTGYNLILNERAQLAMSIGASLADSSPIVGPLVRVAILGTGFSDFILRFYALHVFIIPMIMLLLMMFHFPRNLVLDLPMVSAIIGGLLIVGGLFPIGLGVKFEPTKPLSPTVPEWYLTGVYALIRTGYDRFFTGGLLPLIFILMFFVVPFIDRSRKFNWKERPFFTALGVTSLGQIAVTTLWGFYIDPDINKDLFSRIFIDPLLFYGVLILISVVSFGVTYTFLKWVKLKESKMGVARKRGVGKPIVMARKWIIAVILAFLGFQILMNLMAYQAFLRGFQNLSLFEIGVVLVIFSIIANLYRFSKQAKS